MFFGRQSKPTVYSLNYLVTPKATCVVQELQTLTGVLSVILPRRYSEL